MITQDTKCKIAKIGFPFSLLHDMKHFFVNSHIQWECAHCKHQHKDGQRFSI